MPQGLRKPKFPLAIRAAQHHSSSYFPNPN